MYDHFGIALFFEKYWFLTPIQSVKVDKNVEVLTVNDYRLKYITLLLRFVFLCCVIGLTIFEFGYSDLEEKCKIVFVMDVAYHCGEEVVFIIVYLKDILMDYRRLDILNVANQILEENLKLTQNRKAKLLNNKVSIVVFCFILCICRQVLRAIVGIRHCTDVFQIAFLAKRMFCSISIQIAIILWIVQITAVIEMQINICSKVTYTEHTEHMQLIEIKETLIAIKRLHKSMFHLTGLLKVYFSLDIFLIVISKYLSLLLDLLGIYFSFYVTNEAFKLEIVFNVFYYTVQLFLVIVPCVCLNTSIDKLCDMILVDNILLGGKRSEIRKLVRKLINACFKQLSTYAFALL